MKTARPRSLPRAHRSRLFRTGLSASSLLLGLRSEAGLPKTPFRVGTPTPRGWLGEANSGDPAGLAAAPLPGRGELFFIDAAVADPNAFWLAAPRGATVVCVPAGVDSWQFMADEAANFRNLRAIHVISHGAPGALTLNGRRYTVADLEQRPVDLGRLGRALSKNGDILLYGCDTGLGAEGAKLVTTLAEFTGADVAASTNPTGGLPGDDWKLEVASGDVQTATVAPDDYGHTLGTITVTTNADSGAGSLRQAIADAAANDTITFNAGMTITLSSALAIAKNLTIDGDLNNDGTSDVTIDANYNSRVISITAGTVTLDGLVVTKGLVYGNGGGFGALAGGNARGAGLSITGGTVTIGHSTISNHAASGGGGGGGGSGYSYGGGGGGGFSGKGGGNGGAYNGGISGTSGGSGTGGLGGNNGTPAQAGHGGSTTGGSGGASAVGFYAGGAGATAGTIGGGGGGAGASGGATGGAGGEAAGGMYIGASATVNLFSTTVSGNLAAGGGGGGGYSSTGGAGGRGVGGILNLGTLHYQNSTVTFSSNTGAGGTGGSGNPNGANGSSVANIGGSGTVDSNWTPPDTTPPTVSGVTSSTANGSYKAGGTISIQVNFSENVTVTGTPQLTLETGTTDEVVNYASGSGSSTLTFSYTIQAGDTSSDLDYVATTSLALSGGTIKDGAGNDAILTLATPGAAGSLGANKNLVVDTTAPAAPSTPDMTAGTDTGSSSTDNITSNTTPTFTGTAEAGSAVTLYDTDGTTSLGTATATGGNWSITSSTLSAGSHTLTAKATDAAGNTSAASSGLSVTIDTTAPTTTIATAAFSADTGTSNTDFVTKTAAQTVSGTLSATIAADELVQVSQDNGSTWSTATTTVGQNTWSISATLAGSNTLKVRVADTAGNNGSVFSQAYVLDTTAPATTVATAAFSADTGTSSSDFITKTAAQTLSGTLSANVAAGEVVEVSLDNGATWSSATTSVGANTWSISATLAASDTLKVRVTDVAGNSGSVASQAYVLDTTAPTTTVSTAAFSADTGTSSTDFVTKTASQTISGTLSANLASGESVEVSLDNGATWSSATATVGQNTWSLSGQTLAGSDTLKVRVTDAAGNSGSVFSQAYVLDTTAPGVTFSALALSADTGTSSTDFVTNTPAQTITATLSGAPAGTDVVYGSLDNGGTWTDVTSKVSGTTLTWNGVTLTASDTLKLKVADAAGNDGAVASQAYTLDTTAPSVTSVGVPSNSTYLAGQNLDFTANWDENVVVDTTGGTPRIALTVGATTRYATYQSGSGTNALVFRYTTQAGDLDANGITIGALAANGGTIRDTAGNDATLTLNSVGSTANVNVDAVAPTVTGRTVPSDGTYKTGQNLDFTVTYSENVTVNTGGGTPYIAVTLATGGSVQAAYNGGTGTSTLTFRYTVASGNLDPDGIAVASSITLNGGTIKDGTGNDAATTSLGFAATTGVLVDGVAPSVSSINRQTPSGASTNATSVVFRVTFAEAVTGVDTADFTLTKTATADGTIASVDAVSGTVYDVTVNAITGNGTLRLDLKASGTGIADAATNAIATGYTSGQTYTIDSAAPTVQTSVRQSPTTVNSDAASVTWRVTFSENVTGVDAADFTLTAGTGSPSGTISSVSAVDAKTYDVAVTPSGQGGLRLDLKASGTGITDTAGNAISGGFTTGDFYIVGVTSVFDSLKLNVAANVTTSLAATNKPAQRFTTAAGQPLTLSTVVAKLNTVTGTPTPVVKIYTDNAGAPGTVVGTALTNPSSLTASALNVWTGSVSLSPSTTYWIVFEETATTYTIDVATVTTGGSGTWLNTSGNDYLFRYGTNSGTTQTGAILLALGATSVPSITSTLTASATYRTAFTYQITATNTPTSYAATGLPTGLSVNTSTGAITGSPTQTGSFNVSLTATNGSGTGSASTLVLTVAKAPLTVTAADASRQYGASNPSFSINYSGLLGGDTPAGLTTAPTATSAATASSPAGTYTISASGGVSDNYSFTYVAGTLTVTAASQTITFDAIGDVVLGQSVSLSASASSGLPVTFAVVSGPATLSGSTVSTTGVGTVTVRATQAGNGNYDAASASRSFEVIVGSPTVTTPEQVPVPPVGGTATLVVGESNPNLNYQWQRNGSNVVGATGTSLTLPDAQPPVAGLYTYTATVPGGGSGTSEPVIVGLTTTEKVIGTGEVVGADIVHPNGNVYDQVLLEGKGATLTASAKKVTRISFVDLSNDIVQVEFSGAGSLSVVMDDAGTPAPAELYNQPGVDYVKGHVGLVITGADETSNVSVFSVGRYNAVNQALFREGVNYDGVADIAFIAIQSKNGKFGGIRTGNVSYFASSGFTGIYAPGVEIVGPVNVGNIEAYDAAQPVFVIGSAEATRITGGDLHQPNGAAVEVKGLSRLEFVVGTTSQGAVLPAQHNRAVLKQDGVDVTDLIVVNP